MKTIVKIEFPLKRLAALKHDKFYSSYPLRIRWFGWLFGWDGGSVGEFGGNRTNTVRHLQLFRWHLLTIHRNEYEDRSDKERADEYLSKWSECEKELRGFRLMYLGDSTGEEVKKVIREAWGINLDEGRIE